MSGFTKNKFLSHLNIQAVHPVASLVPINNDEHINFLGEDICKNGLKKSIIVTKNRALVDGKNRLLACQMIGVIPTVKVLKENIEPIIYYHKYNFDSRHLTPNAQTIYAARLIELLAADRCFMEHNFNAIGDKPLTRRNLRKKLIGFAVDITGVSARNINKALRVLEFTPKLANEIYSNKIILTNAYKEATEVKEVLTSYSEQKPSPKKLGKLIRLNNEEIEIKAPLISKFNKTKGNIDWAKWSWNPITGCLHKCKFCYAKAITLNKMYSHLFPLGFEPVLHPNRLDAPKNTTADGGRVFVCSMADLFGSWIPDEWINLVFDACISAPEHEYIFLTKWPNRYNMLEKIPKAWFGASVIKQSDVTRVENQMKSFSTAGKKWISLEPMLEPILFNDLSWCDLVVIGAQTAANGQPSLAPEFDWIVDVVNQCRDAGVPYYLKSNLEKAPGMQLPRAFPSL